MPVPIRAWLVGNGEERILVDMGEATDVKDALFALRTVMPEDELPFIPRAGTEAPTTWRPPATAASNSGLPGT